VAYKGVLHYVFADAACFDPEAHKASRSIPCGYRVILVKANACRISTSIVLHTVAIFSRLSSLLTKRIPEVLYANSGLRFGISKNPEGHYNTNTAISKRRL